MISPRHNKTSIKRRESLGFGTAISLCALVVLTTSSAAGSFVLRVAGGGQDVVASPEHAGGDKFSDDLSKLPRDVGTSSIPAKNRRDPGGQLVLGDRIDFSNEPDDRFLQFRRWNLVDRSDCLGIRLIAGSHDRRRLARKGEKTIR